MAEAISALNSNSAVVYTPTVPNATYRTQTAQDSVVLSVTAQAKLLERRGLSVGEIAYELGISTSTVQNDLGLALAAATQTKAATA
jgi:DNA-binding NarL/FixJ family response regulator